MTVLAASNVWLNGRLVPSDIAHISVYDRGFQIGDGVFETFRARRGVAIEFAGHVARLHASLAALEFDLPCSDDELADGLAGLLTAEGLDGHKESAGDAVVRITVSRGFDAGRGVKPNPAQATAVIQVWPFRPPSDQILSRGIGVVVSRIRRDPDSPMAEVKTISRAELVYARIEAGRAGADDAVFLTSDGRLTEATTSNVLVFIGDACATARLGTGILAGTTRAWLMEHGREVGLTMTEHDLRLEDVSAADEMALCSSVAGVVPVVSVDGRQVGDGKPGRRTAALRRLREDWIDQMSLEGARKR